MAQQHAFLEEISSQIFALQLLVNMGWQYLTPTEALTLRGGKAKNVILTSILEPWLRQHNQIHELLTLGTSLNQTIDGDPKSYSLHYIDWHTPANNVFHVSDEFDVEKRGSHHKRIPDIVLFVNGISLVVIEFKRADKDHHGEKAVALGIEQQPISQREDEIPHLYLTSQLLLAISPDDALYATTATHKDFWSIWRKEEKEVGELDVNCHWPHQRAPVHRNLGKAILVLGTRSAAGVSNCWGRHLPT